MLNQKNEDLIMRNKELSDQLEKTLNENNDLLNGLLEISEIVYA